MLTASICRSSATTRSPGPESDGSGDRTEEPAGPSRRAGELSRASGVAHGPSAGLASPPRGLPHLLKREPGAGGVGQPGGSVARAGAPERPRHQR
jgi:hypothetical protein